MSYNEEQVREIFFEEMREIFENIDRYILVLERIPGDLDIIRNLFREVHTLKGSSGVFGLREICDLTHHAEDLLDRMRESKLVPTEDVFSVLLRCFDRLKEMMAFAKTDKPLTGFDNSELVRLLCEFKEEVKDSNKLSVSGKIDIAEQPEPVRNKDLDSSKKSSGKFEYTIVIQGCENYFLMGIDPSALLMNCRDLAMSRFNSSTQVQNIPPLTQMDPERCYLEFVLKFDSDSPYEKIRDIFEFVYDTSRISIAVNGESAVILGQKVSAEVPVKNQAKSESVSSPALEAKVEPKGNSASSPLPPVHEPKVLPVTEAPVLSVMAVPEIEVKPPERPRAVSIVPPVPVAQPVVVSTPTDKGTSTPPAPPKAASPASVVTPQATAPQAASAATQAPSAPSMGASGGSSGAAGNNGDANDFVRIKKEKLDQLMNLVGELITVKNLFVHLANRLDSALPGSELTKQFKEGTGTVTRLSSGLQESVMNARMVPVGTVFSKYIRLVRDISKKLNKKVNLVIEGEDTELDKTVSEAISDPIMHLIRNAIDHGIETPDLRLERGKPEFGTIFLKASYEGNNVKIIVKDDGNGLDNVRIREKATRLGFCTPEQAESMSKREIHEMIFQPGFSTASEVTDISGRGVGMDVVRNNIRKSSGSIIIETEFGGGTEFRILLPLSLAVIDALLIGCDGETYAVPQEVIIESVRAEPDEIANLNNQPSINLRDEVIPLLRLAEHLPIRVSVLDEFITKERIRARHEETNQNGRDVGGTVPIVIVQIDGTKVGILVDELYWQEQIMIKPLGGFLANISVFSGACIMGNGNVVLVLEPKEMYRQARSSDRKVA